MQSGFIEYVYEGYNRLTVLLYTTAMSKCFCEIGKGTRIAPPLRHIGLSGIKLGSHIYIGRNCWLMTVSGYRERTAKLIVQDHAVLSMDVSISAADEIIIGRHVAIGRNTFIADHNHEYRDIHAPIYDQGISTIKPVVIESNTWIGQNVIILPGTKIGKNCVVGANSVVNTVIPDYSVAVGIPAKIVKRYNAETKCWDKY